MTATPLAVALCPLYLFNTQDSADDQMLILTMPVVLGRLRA
jgi:hypothetical protein